MKVWKNLAITFIFIMFFHTVTAQGLGGAELSVEESLVDFVNNILGFPVSSAADVLLYVIGPIIAFYFLIVNFATEGYNNFQERLERRDYYESDEDLPIGMKVFSLVTSFITVVTIGQIAPGLILLIGGLALLLALIMFLGLVNFGNRGNDNGGRANDGGEENDGATTDDHDDATRADYISRLSDAAESAASGARDHLDRQAENQKNEAFRYFQEDFIREMASCESEISSDIRIRYRQAKNEMGSADSTKGVFKKIVNRAGDVYAKTERYEQALNTDSPSTGPTAYSGSNLETAIMDDISNDKGINVQLQDIKKKINSLLKNDRVSPPSDVFDKVHEDIKLILAVGHFFHYYPENINSEEAAQECLQAAASKNLYSLPASPEDLNKLQDLYDEGYKREVLKLVSSLHELAEEELHLTEGEISAVSDLANKDGRAKKNLDSIIHQMNDYNPKNGNFDGHKTYLDRMRSFMTGDIANLISSLQDRVNSDKEYETKVYRELSALEDKI